MKGFHKILFVIVGAFNLYKFKKTNKKQSDVISHKDFLKYYKSLCDVPYY